MEKCGCGAKYNTEDEPIIFCPLHAAAGEMLQALERLLELCQMHRSNIRCYGADRDIELARTAILKAKGE